MSDLITNKSLHQDEAFHPMQKEQYDYEVAEKNPRYMENPLKNNAIQKEEDPYSNDILKREDYKTGDLDPIIEEVSKEKTLLDLKKEFDTGKEYKRHNIFGQRKGNSKKMKGVIDSVSMLVNFFYTGVIKKGMDKDVFDHAYRLIDEQYRNVIENCEVYLSDAKKNKNNARYAMVLRMKEAAFRELSHLSSASENTYNYVQKSGDINELTWLDVIRDARSVHYEDGKNGVRLTQTGANSSSVTVIEENGKKQFFKGDEILGTHSANDVKGMINESINDPKLKLSKEEKDKAHKITDNISDNNQLTEELKLRIFENVHKIADKLIIEKKDVQNRVDFENTMSAIIAKRIREMPIPEPANIDGIVNSIVSVFTKRFDETDSEEERLKYISQDIELFKKVFAETGRMVFAESFMKKMANVPLGANVSANNVVTSRFANLLGVNFIAESKSTLVTINGETKKGIVMEEAKGELSANVPQLSPGFEKYEKTKPIITSIVRRERAIREDVSIADRNYYNEIDKIKTILARNDIIKNEEVSSITPEEVVKRYKENTAHPKLVKDKEYLIHNQMFFRCEKDKENADNELRYYTSRSFANLEEMEELKKLEGVGKDKDITFDEIKKNYNDMNGHITKYSGNAKRELMNLSIMDFILGQVDRHAGNYNVEKTWVDKTWVITKITCFDNDACCGLMTGKEMDMASYQGQRHSRLKDKNGAIKIPALDMDFAEKILSLEPATLNYEFMDLLSKEQLDAMANRLNYVKDIIREEIEKEKDGANSIKFIKNEAQWEDYGKDPLEVKKMEDYNSMLFRTDRFSMG